MTRINKNTTTAHYTPSRRTASAVLESSRKNGGLSLRYSYGQIFIMKMHLLDLGEDVLTVILGHLPVSFHRVLELRTTCKAFLTASKLVPMQVELRNRRLQPDEWYMSTCMSHAYLHMFTLGVLLLSCCVPRIQSAAFQLAAQI